MQKSQINPFFKPSLGTGIFLTGSILFILVAIVLTWTSQSTPQNSMIFDANRAYQDVQFQDSLGPRTPGSEAHKIAAEWIVTELKKAGWQAEYQDTQLLGHSIRNVIGKRGSGSSWVVLGAHYDSRFIADQDPNKAMRINPVPGANDGASGVAVLLELARTLPKDLNKQIWIVFFDAEDQGNIPGWDWILGSTAFANSLTSRPDAVVVIDMIGDADLNIYKEMNSDKRLNDEIWTTAAKLGYSQSFFPTYKHRILDDHVPFLKRGIPAVDLIDFDYPYWHTTADKPDKVSASSLGAVGKTLEYWLSH
jgi:glutaminyl-peptide cyclotransferase